MRKYAEKPDSGDDLSEESSTAYSECVVIEGRDHKRVHVSGTTSDESHEDIGEQTRDVLSQIEDVLARFGGEMSDVVRVRVYVEEPYLVQEEFEKVHEARREFFERGSYPASTLVEVSGLIREGRVIEIDADAVIPHDGWSETER